MADKEASTEPVGEPVSGWAAVGSLLAPRMGRRQFLIGGLCALLGFAVVVQVHQTNEANLSGLSQDELVRILDEAQIRADALTAEAADLDRELQALESGSDTRVAALAAAERNAQVQGILTGRLPASGPGVEIVMTDTDTLRPSVLLNTLEELRNAGAEAIEINGVRVIGSSSFTGSAGRIVLDGTLLDPPYQWLVIGGSQTIATALDIPGGANAAVRRDGALVEVIQRDAVAITAITYPETLSYATAVPEPSS